MSHHASRWSAHGADVRLPHGPGRAWWPTAADLESMVGLKGPTAPVDPWADEAPARLRDRPGTDSPTVLAARLSLLFR